MQINTNLASLLTRYQLDRTTGRMESVMERISSGKRINNAGDDTAAMNIRTYLSTQIRGNEVGQKNMEDGLAMVKTADAGLVSIEDMLQRIRQLLIQSDNDTYGIEDKQAMQKEITTLLSLIDGVANKTNFNEITVLNTAASSAPPLVGLDETVTTTVNSQTGALPTMVEQAFTLTTPPGSVQTSFKVDLQNLQWGTGDVILETPADQTLLRSGMTNNLSYTFPQPILKAELKMDLRGDIQNVGMYWDSTSMSFKTNNEYATIKINGTDLGQFGVSDDNNPNYEAKGTFDITSLLGGAGATDTVNITTIPKIGGGTPDSPGNDNEQYVGGMQAKYQLVVTLADGTIYQERYQVKGEVIDPDGNVVKFNDTAENATFMFKNPKEGVWKVRLSNAEEENSEPITINAVYEGIVPGTGLVKIHSNYSAEPTDLALIGLTDATITALGIDAVSVASAGASITAIDGALEYIQQERAKWGAYGAKLTQRLDFTTQSTMAAVGARSKVEDADIALELSNLAKDKILRESAVTMLVHANQNKQTILEAIKQNAQ